MTKRYTVIVCFLAQTILVQCVAPDHSGYGVRSSYDQNIGQYNDYKSLNEHNNIKQHQEDWYRQEQQAASKKDAEKAEMQKTEQDRVETQRKDTEQAEVLKKEQQQKHDIEVREQEQQRVAEQHARDTQQHERATASRDDEECRYAHKVQQQKDEAHRWDTEHTHTVQQEAEKNEMLRKDYDARQKQYEHEDKERQIHDEMWAQAHDPSKQYVAKEYVSTYADVHKQPSDSRNTHQTRSSDTSYIPPAKMSVVEQAQWARERQEQQQQHKQRQDEDALYNKFKAVREHMSIVREAQRRLQGNKADKHTGALSKLMSRLGLSSKHNNAHKQVQMGEAERQQKDALQSPARHLQKEQHMSLESEKKQREQKRKAEHENELEETAHKNIDEEDVDRTSQSQQVQIQETANDAGDKDAAGDQQGEQDGDESEIREPSTEPKPQTQESQDTRVYSVCGTTFKFNVPLRRTSVDQATQNKDMDVEEGGVARARSSSGLHENKFACPLCPKRFTAKNSVKRHILNIHKDKIESTENVVKEYSCILTGCTSSFGSWNNLNAHMKKPHPNKQRLARKHKCEFAGCSGSFNDRSELRRHARSHRNFVTKYQCAKCKELFPDRKKLCEHQLTAHPKKCFSCDICPRKFKSQLRFNSHRSQHLKSVSMYPKNTTTELRVPGKPYECNIRNCQKSYAGSSGLLKHKRNKHKKQTDDKNAQRNQTRITRVSKNHAVDKNTACASSGASGTGKPTNPHRPTVAAASRPAYNAPPQPLIVPEEFMSFRRRYQKTTTPADPAQNTPATRAIYRTSAATSCNNDCEVYIYPDGTQRCGLCGISCADADAMTTHISVCHNIQ